MMCKAFFAACVGVILMMSSASNAVETRASTAAKSLIPALLADADSPASVMTAFFTAVEKGDYAAAKALLSTKGKAKMNDESLKSMTEILKGGFTVGEAEVDGDNAKIKCSVPKRRKATSFYLVKEGGKWLYQGN
jgi:uncharacterized membrane protein YvbJ